MRQKRLSSGMVQASDKFSASRFGRPLSGRKELHCEYCWLSFAPIFSVPTLNFTILLNILQATMVHFSIQWSTAILILIMM